jgi:hypothetical protein
MSRRAQMQSIDITSENGPADEAAPEARALRVNAAAPAPGECCYPIGEPRRKGFHYCTVPVAWKGAVYCLEHLRLCHIPASSSR